MEDEYGINPNIDQSESINGIYIPQNILECFLELDKLLKDEAQRFILEIKSPMDLHMNLGNYIRNNWGLWRSSRLFDYMKERRGFDADHMSWLILSYYWDYLNGNDDNWKKFDLNINKN